MILSNIYFILVRPQMGENIGSVARAIKNFNIKHLRLVNPRCNWPNQKALATSVGAKDVLKSAKIYDSVEKSIGDLDIIFASSSRIRNVNKKTISVLNFKKKIKKGRKIGILFGPEASGLSNEDISYSNYIFKIPVSKKFESLNLSHSLIIVCFELFKIIKPSFFNKQKKLSDIASKKKFNEFFDFLQTSLERKGFFVPTEKKKAMLINLRNIFGRIELSNKELRILSSVFSKL